jgi:hypothetical protein
MENPFLIPPRVEGPQSRSWGVGFTWGFQGPAFSSLTTDNLAIEDADAFDLGVLAGQQAAIEGVPLDNPCVDLSVEHPALLAWENPNEVGEVFGVFIEVVFIGTEIAKHTLMKAAAGAIFSGPLLLLELAIGLETFSEDPEVELSRRAALLGGALADLGFSEPMECFLGAGIDLSATGCELKMTPLFRHLDDARSAARGMGRPAWIVVSWRNNQSGGAKLVASSRDGS